MRYHRNDLLTACFDAAAGGQSPGEGGVDCGAADTQRAVTSPRVTGMSPARGGGPGPAAAPGGRGWRGPPVRAAEPPEQGAGDELPGHPGLRQNRSEAPVSAGADGEDCFGVAVFIARCSLGV